MKHTHDLDSLFPGEVERQVLGKLLHTKNSDTVEPWVLCCVLSTKEWLVRQHGKRLFGGVKKSVRGANALLADLDGQFNNIPSCLGLDLNCACHSRLLRQSVVDFTADLVPFAIVERHRFSTVKALNQE